MFFRILAISFLAFSWHMLALRVCGVLQPWRSCKGKGDVNVARQTKRS